MTSLLQTGLNGHLPAPPEKRFLISENLKGARSLGMHPVLAESPESVRPGLARVGVEIKPEANS